MAHWQMTYSGTGGHPIRIPTPTEAHAKIVEVFDQIRQFTANEDLNDATKLKSGTLSLNSRLWMLRSLWYAEPIRLEAVDQWISRIEEEMLEKLDDLDILIQHRMSKTADARGMFTSNVIVNGNKRSPCKEAYDDCSARGRHGKTPAGSAWTC